MNPMRKYVLKYSKPRSIYDPFNTTYRKRWNPSTQKEDMRMEKRLKKINRYDDDETGEPPIEQLSQTKAKTVFKMLNDFQNMHRFSRKEIPLEEKKEYIQKCKEFSLWKTNVWRHEFNEIKNCLAGEEEMLKSGLLLPPDLMEEVFDIEGALNDTEAYQTEPITEEDDPKFKKNKDLYESDGELEEKFKENSENIVQLEFTEEFLYLPQLLKIYPDDYNIIFKTMINMESYEETKIGTAAESEATTVSAGGEDLVE